MAKAIYARVSTEDQAKKGYSLPDQIASCKALYFAKGETDNIIEYVDDGYSGEFIDRPALCNLRDDIAAGRIDTVVVYDPDRLARKLSIQLLVAEEIEKSKATLHFVTGDYDSSPDGRLFFSMRGAIAEFEKAKILDRTLRGKIKKASGGKIIARYNLYGYDYDKENNNYRINKDEAELIKKMFKFVADEKMSLQGIQRKFQELVIPSPTGKSLWPISTIQRMLTNKTYMGTFESMKYRYKKTGIRTKTRTKRPLKDWITISVPPIIDDITFARVQEQLNSNKIICYRKHPHSFLLTGILRCGICGRNMVSHYCQRRTGIDKPYYICSTKKYFDLKNAGFKCSGRMLPAESIENDIWKKLISAIAKPSLLKKYAPKDQEKVSHTAELNRLGKLEADLLKRRETLAKWYADQMISEEAASEQLEKIKSDLSSIQKRRNSLKSEGDLEGHNGPTFEEKAKNLKSVIKFSDDLDFEEKRLIILSLLKKITVIRTDPLEKKNLNKPEYSIVWEPY